MGKVSHVISETQRDWIGEQKLFFVATAPLSASGHVNCSPKGLDSFRVLDERTVVYQDLTGSGVETIAHVQENQRILIMFCAFEGSPKILRLHGKGEVIRPGHPDFAYLNGLFPQRAGVRAYIRVHVSRVADSCGYAVPLYTFEKDRDVLDKWAAHNGEDGLTLYREEKNRNSLDGLPGIA